MTEADQLLEQVRNGDSSAVGLLLDRHRLQLRKMVSLRLDARITGRVDPSDVVQETLSEAAKRLNDYLESRQIPFYPWLRQIAWEKLIQTHRRHIGSRKRSAAREAELPIHLSDESVASLSRIAVSRQESPSEQIVRAELYRRTAEALERLRPSWKELLIMKYVEQMSVADIAATLEISAGAVSMRHLRAVEALRKELNESEL